MPNGHHVRLAIMAKCEPGVLRRAVDSARSMIDSVCIVIAPKDYATLPPEGLGIETIVKQIPWQGYAPTRTATLRAAEADSEVDWILMMDADDVFSHRSRLPDLDVASRLGCDAYTIPIEARGPGYRWRWYRNWHLLRARRGFGWKGTGETHLHERLIVDGGGEPSAERFVMRWDELVYHYVHDPKRPSRRTFDNEAREFGAAREALPLDTRTAFFYAQSLKDAGRDREAFEAFAHRARMIGGNPEETFWAKLEMGKLAARVGEEPLRFLLEAHRFDPRRAEPLHAIAAYYRFESRYELAFEYATQAAACAYPKDVMFFVDVMAYSETALREAGIDPT